MSELDALVGEIEPQLIATRRDFHRYAESGWCEFRTASLIARRLADLGYQVQAGRAVIKEDERMGVPPVELLEARWRRAVGEGGDPNFWNRSEGA